jgi:hypothetical protein
VPTLVELLQLHLASDIEPDLEEDDSRLDQHTLEGRRLEQELPALRACAKPHDRFDAAAVVPGAVEEHDLAACRQMFGITLEVPLAALAFGRLRQGNDARGAWIHVLADGEDDAALAGGVAALDQRDDAPTDPVDVRLQLDQLDLERRQRRLVVDPGHGVIVRVTARGERRALHPIRQHGIVEIENAAFRPDNGSRDIGHEFGRNRRPPVLPRTPVVLPAGVLFGHSPVDPCPFRRASACRRRVALSICCDALIRQHGGESVAFGGRKVPPPPERRSPGWRRPIPNTPREAPGSSAPFSGSSTAAA